MHINGWYGLCPDEYPRGLNLKFETIRIMNIDLLNTSCERNYSYREYQKNISATSCNSQHRADYSVGR